MITWLELRTALESVPEDNRNLVIEVIWPGDPSVGLWHGYYFINSVYKGNGLVISDTGSWTVQDILTEFEDYSDDEEISLWDNSDSDPDYGYVDIKTAYFQRAIQHGPDDDDIEDACFFIVVDA